jgi:hypothetical protein
MACLCLAQAHCEDIRFSEKGRENIRQPVCSIVFTRSPADCELEPC